MSRDLVDLVLRYDDVEMERVRANLDVDRSDELHAHLLAALKRKNISERDIDQCELDVYKPGFRDPEFTYTAIDADG